MVEQRTENPCVVGSIPTGGTTNADVAHLVERHLAKVEVASSSLVIRSSKRPSQMRWFFFEIQTEKWIKGIAFSPPLLYNKSRKKQNMFMESCPSWSKEHDWKSCKSLKRLRGFESLALRQKSTNFDRSSSIFTYYFFTIHSSLTFVSIFGEVISKK